MIKKKPVEFAIESLKRIEGDIVVTVLFLPVALMFQNIAGALLKPENAPISVNEQTIDFVLNVVRLTLLLSICIIEVLALSATLIAWVYDSLSHLIVLGVSILIFMAAIAVMGYTDKDGFRVALLTSVCAAFGVAFFLFDWKQYMETREKDFLFVTMAFFLSAFMHICLFMP